MFDGVSDVVVAVNVGDDDCDYNVPMIFPVFKPIGITTHALAKLVSTQTGELTTHTGSLDPMAEGVVVMLTGLDRYRKSELNTGSKIYEFKVIFGFESDTFDVLGRLQNYHPTPLSDSVIESNLKMVLPKFIGSQTQRLPNFSARRYQGKSFFDLARSGQSVPIVDQSIEVFSLELISVDKMSVRDVLESACAKVSRVKGDFRQSLVLEDWRDLPQNFGHDQVVIAELRAETSKRTYIRGLVRDIVRDVGISGLVYSLCRAENNGYKLTDCWEMNLSVT